jgi:hypothetical protein
VIIKSKKQNFLPKTKPKLAFSRYAPPHCFQLELLNPKDKVTQINGNNSNNSNHLNIYSSPEALTHALEKSQQENVFLKEKNSLLESEVVNLKEIIMLLKEKCKNS